MYSSYTSPAFGAGAQGAPLPCEGAHQAGCCRANGWRKLLCRCWHSVCVREALSSSAQRRERTPGNFRHLENFNVETQMVRGACCKVREVRSSEICAWAYKPFCWFLDFTVRFRSGRGMIQIRATCKVLRTNGLATTHRTNLPVSHFPLN